MQKLQKWRSPITPNVKLHPPNWGVIEKRPVSTKKNWNSAGVNLDHLPKAWRITEPVFQLQKKEVIGIFHMGLKHQFTWFLLWVEKKQRFFSGPPKFWRAFQKYPGRLPSGPTLTGPPSTWRDVTSAPDFDVSLWDSSLSSAQLEDKVRPPLANPPPSSPMPTKPPIGRKYTPWKLTWLAGKIPHGSIGNESSNGGRFYCHVSFRGV